LVLLPIQICLSDDYVPLTDGQILYYWSTLSEEQKLEEIRKLDIIEHTIPELSQLQLSAILTTEGDLIISTVEPLNMKVGHLEYKITIPEHMIEGFHQEDFNIMPYIISGLIGLAGGIVIMYIVN